MSRKREEVVALQQCGTPLKAEDKKKRMRAALARPKTIRKVCNLFANTNKKTHPCWVCFLWRREEDSNLRYVSGAHTISNRAP